MAIFRPTPLGGRVLYSYVADPLTQIDLLGLSEGSGTLGKRMSRAGSPSSFAHGISPFPRSDFRAHHVIPHEVWTNNQTFFDDISSGKQDRSPRFLQGFNPKDAATGSTYGLDQYHAGGHGNTNFNMETEVANIRSRFDQQLVTKSQARKEISALQKAERKRLSRRGGGPCIQMP